MYKRKDFFYKKAKNEGYRSRAAYKLLEINKKFKIFKSSHNVLDLGCAPGGWLQVVSRLCSNGSVYGIDLLKTEPLNLKNVFIIQGDILDSSVTEKIKHVKFNSVISDMAPNTSGIKHADYFKSFELCKTAFKIAKLHLKNNGNFIVKIFQGREFEDFYKSLKKHFDSVKIFKPQSSRDSSSETYIIARNFKHTR
jgi:23S rRNA (uridine2552-2'-O)-methyltransferase